ncbi:hypothetical protein F0919_04750 [Taibaiella lutea]|uniref:Lipoprotein n=1 Tax=Taibaiella lutea TaxID=2608001 RepID=A0A5M6CPV7_9BACT|nr:hypothetical protein [Taibaiella lutea]KAA5536983.1 hypothetical protein F0919_04750 [Taibaiella lutea]
MNRIYLLFFLVFPAASCVNSTNETTKEQPSSASKLQLWNPPAAGVVVDECKEAIPEDKLNNAFFKVIVIATEISDIGHFDLKLEYGANKNETTIDLPKLNRGTILKPVLKKGEKKYECILGFDEGDGVFRELYLVSVDNKNIKLKQTRYYYGVK